MPLWQVGSKTACPDRYMQHKKIKACCLCGRSDVKLQARYGAVGVWFNVWITFLHAVIGPGAICSKGTKECGASVVESEVKLPARLGLWVWFNTPPAPSRELHRPLYATHESESC
jgi:hypothetical protein